MKFILSVLFAIFASPLFSQDTECQVSQVPYAGESVWSTKTLFVPIIDGDGLDTIPSPSQWVITDKVRMICPDACGGDIRTFDILTAAIASDGQSASYLVQEVSFVRSSYKDKNGKTIRVIRKGTTPIQTLLILCPEGIFDGIYLISDNGGFVKYQ